jgi:glutathione synthase
MARALEHPERFVMKPQREGGGNNVYGEDIRPLLESLGDSQERSAYILMDMIQPPTTLNYMVRPGSQVQLVKCLSELGIFGYIIG